MLKAKMSRSFSQLTKLALAAALTVAALSGCASQQVKQAGPVFFPPPPNPPRIQFLKGINNSDDIDAKKSSFSLLITGKPDEEKNFEITKPYGVTAHDKKIYVCDLAGRIVIIDPAKKTFDYFYGSGYGGLKKPLNIAFDDAGNRYVVDIERKEVLVFNPDGGFITTIGKEENMKPTDVVVEGDYVYILDMTGGEIKVFNKDGGKLERSIGKFDQITRQGLAMPTNFTIDKQGSLRVTNMGTSNVVQIDKDGHVLASFGKLGDGFGEFARPKGIAVDREGNLYVVDAAHQNVQVFNENGRLLMFFGGGSDAPGMMNLPAGVSVSKADMEYFNQFVDPSFQLDSLIFVTNQFGKARLSVYGLGHAKGTSAQSNKPVDKPADKPAETKPAETKPAETKPAETKPAAEKPSGN